MGSKVASSKAGSERLQKDLDGASVRGRLL